MPSEKESKPDNPYLRLLVFCLLILAVVILVFIICLRRGKQQRKKHCYRSNNKGKSKKKKKCCTQNHIFEFDIPSQDCSTEVVNQNIILTVQRVDSTHILFQYNADPKLWKFSAISLQTISGGLVDQFPVDNQGCLDATQFSDQFSGTPDSQVSFVIKTIESDILLFSTVATIVPVLGNTLTKQTIYLKNGCQLPTCQANKTCEQTAQLLYHAIELCLPMRMAYQNITDGDLNITAVPDSTASPIAVLPAGRVVIQLDNIEYHDLTTSTIVFLHVKFTPYISGYVQFANDISPGDSVYSLGITAEASAAKRQVDALIKAEIQDPCTTSTSLSGPTVPDCCYLEAKLSSPAFTPIRNPPLSSTCCSLVFNPCYTADCAARLWTCAWSPSTITNDCNAAASAACGENCG
jgi:hypothetical protein